MSTAPISAIQRPTGISWRGSTGSISRLLLGFDPALLTLLPNLGMPADKVQPALEQIRAALGANLAPPAMPIQGAIDLAVFLAEVAVNFSKFLPGAQVVGGPIEVAAVTKHEGYKWVHRKLYYQEAYNQ